MVRRSTPIAKTDDAAFPVRVKLRIPPRGFGTRLDDVHRWLSNEVGAGQYAVHPAPSTGGNAMAVHLLDVEGAHSFLTHFSDLALADGTLSPAYSTPARDALWSSVDLLGVCNLYSMITSQQAIIDLVDVWKDETGNLPSLPGIYPNYQAPVVANTPEGRVLSMMRWGMPSPAFALKNRNYDRGITNVRNTRSTHWRRWLGVQNRCIVPFTAFSEPNVGIGGNKEPVWFALNEDKPLAFFAGIWTEWTSVRKVKDGETTDKLFAFLTCDPNETVGAIHPKAMPVILTEQSEVETWLNAPTDNALQLQRPLREGLLRIVEGAL